MSNDQFHMWLGFLFIIGVLVLPSVCVLSAISGRKKQERERQAEELLRAKIINELLPKISEKRDEK